MRKVRLTASVASEKTTFHRDLTYAFFKRNYVNNYLNDFLQKSGFINASSVQLRLSERNQGKDHAVSPVTPDR